MNSYRVGTGLGENTVYDNLHRYISSRVDAMGILPINHTIKQNLSSFDGTVQAKKWVYSHFTGNRARRHSKKVKKTKCNDKM